MNIIQCIFCKKPFQTLGRKACPDCLEQIDKDFFVVRDYIYEHKQTNMDKVSEETGVSMQIIRHLLKEGRLQLDEIGGGGGLLVCERCRKPINSGKLCKACTDKVSNTMKGNVDARAAAAKSAADSASFKGSAKVKNK
ncbi:MAG: flagellar protein [Oscillospiraceae bacterium]|nr:flagellar protein [Oscillospiraceae bacterium]